jgi:proteasome lid subunit RPN8/RPN11
MILRLTTEQLQLLREESKRCHPVEACALLFGEFIRGDAVVKKIVLTTNILKSPVEFEVDPEEAYHAFEQAELEGIEFVGFFHHPAPSKPSGIDIKFMRLWAEAAWLVLSSLNGEFGAFQMIGGKVSEITIKTA